MPRGSTVPRYVFATFIWRKIAKLQKSQQPLKQEKKSAMTLNPYNFRNFFDARLTKFINNQILLHKISLRFLLTTKLFTG
jgi:hypothetical protein